MKNFFLTWILLSLLSLTAAPTISLAQQNTTSPPPSTTAISTAQGSSDRAGSSGCAWNSDSWSFCLAWVFEAVLVQTTGLFTYVGGQIFNVAVGFGLDSKSFNVDIVEKGWVIVRDISNMSFIFVLIYIAVTTILNMAGADVKGLIAKVIVVALLINFSLFAAKFVIDVGNILAIQFYDKISVQSATGEPSTTNITGTGGRTFAPSVKDISGVLASGINAQSLLKDKIFQGAVKGSNTGFLERLGIFLFIMLSFAIINIMLAFVFISAAFQFIARVLGLWVVMIMAPAAFIAYILPGMKKWSDTWWRELIRLTFYAPVFMFLFYVAALFITTGITGQGGGQGILIDFANIFRDIDRQASASTFGPLANAVALVFMNAAVVIGLLFAALKVASLMSTQLSTTIGGFINRVGYGVGGWAGRNTFGRFAYGLADSRFFKNTAVGQFINRRALQPLATGSFDMRGAPYLGGALGGKEIGRAGGAGGYEKQLMTAKERDGAFMKKLTPSAVEAGQLEARAEEEAQRRIARARGEAEGKRRAEQAKAEAAGARMSVAQTDANNANREIQDASSRLGITERTLTALNQQIERERAAGRDVTALESNKSATEADRMRLVGERAERQSALAAARERMRQAQNEQREAQRAVRDHDATIANLTEAATNKDKGKQAELYKKYLDASNAAVGVAAKTAARQETLAKSLESILGPAIIRPGVALRRLARLATKKTPFEGLGVGAGDVRAAGVRKEIKTTPEKKLLAEIEKRLGGGGKKEEKESE